MRKASEPEDRQDDIDSIAAAWAARLGGDALDDAERRDLDRWLEQSPRHVAAFKEARAAWDKMGALRFAPDTRAGDIDAPFASAASAQVRSAQGPKRRRIRVQVAALAASLLLLFAAAGTWLADPYTLLTADHRTAPGAQQRVTLTDGSVVELGPASAIAVRYGDKQRRIELLSGIAYFTAAPMDAGENRPFVVAAANGTARALGTQFMAARIADTTEITVAEHEVEVALAASEGRPRVVVPAGKAVRYTGSDLGAVRSVNLDHAMAWRRSRLIVDGIPLRKVVAELARYRHGQIVITDPALASRKVSGVFDMTDHDAVLATITRDLRIKAATLPLVTLLYE